MSVSIYSPEVKREAERYGITDLQAYYKLNAREQIMREEAQHRMERRHGGSRNQPN